MKVWFQTNHRFIKYSHLLKPVGLSFQWLYQWLLHNLSGEERRKNTSFSFSYWWKFISRRHDLLLCFQGEHIGPSAHLEKCWGRRQTRYEALTQSMGTLGCVHKKLVEDHTRWSSIVVRAEAETIGQMPLNRSMDGPVWHIQVSNIHKHISSISHVTWVGML